MDARSKLTASTQDSGTPEAEFEIYCNDEFVANAVGPREAAWADAMHYVSQYVSEGRVSVFELTRKNVSFEIGQE